MTRERKVVFPNELLEDRKVENSIFPETNDEVGFASLSEEDNSQFILRIYHLAFSEEDAAYSPVQELVAFSFFNRHDLDEFIERLPHLSGLEMLMLQNPVTDIH